MICKLFEMQLSTVCTYFCGLFMLLLVSGQTDGRIEQDEQRTRGRQNRGRSLGRGRLNRQTKIQERLGREGTPNCNYIYAVYNLVCRLDYMAGPSPNLLIVSSQVGIASWLLQVIFETPGRFLEPFIAHWRSEDMKIWDKTQRMMGLERGSSSFNKLFRGFLVSSR